MRRLSASVAPVLFSVTELFLGKLAVFRTRRHSPWVYILTVPTLPLATLLVLL